MKTKIAFALMTLILQVEGNLARAAKIESYQPSINCTTADLQIFTIRLSHSPDQYFSESQEGLATPLHGLNAAIKGSPVAIQSEPILTGAVTGFSLAFSLPDGIHAKIRDITFAAAGSEDLLGITGVANLKEGSSANLTCD